MAGTSPSMTPHRFSYSRTSPKPMTPPYETLGVERSGRVATITFRRADQLNAMNKRMQGEITAAFEALSDDETVGAIIVTGEGRGFMAGADIKEYAAQTGAEFDAFQAAGTRMY